MVQMNENNPEFQPKIKLEKESLLKKFDIPINHLDFEYLKRCNNSKEIEKILQILRSGEEGYFPVLVKFTEKRLYEVNPNSKLLRTTASVLSKCDISKDEWDELSSDLQDWVEDVSKNDKELILFQDIKSNTNNIPVREFKNERQSKLESKTNRIKAMDYEAWDKLDVDTEILKMDIHDEKMKQEALKKVEDKEKLNTVVLHPDLMSKTELYHAALQAKNAGNECYKLRDFEEALQYYTNSLIFIPSATVYNNRAITNIKLGKYEDAIIDCNEVLKTEEKNEKAYLRKSTAYKYLKQYDKAIENLEKFLQFNPNSVDAQNLMQDLKKLIGKNLSVKTVRMKIQDHAKITQNNDKINNECVDNTNLKVGNIKKKTEKEMIENVLIPIPSTSSSHGPFYRVVNLPTDITKTTSNTSKSKSEENVINLHETRIVDSNSQKIIDIKDLQKKNYEKISPYEFLKRWQAIKNDTTLREHEKLLRSLNLSYLSKVVGSELDGEMFSILLKCLVLRFTKQQDIILIETILTELQKIPRINIIILLMDDDDKINIRVLLSRFYNKVLNFVYGVSK